MTDSIPEAAVTNIDEWVPITKDGMIVGKGKIVKNADNTIGMIGILDTENNKWLKDQYNLGHVGGFSIAVNAPDHE